MTPVLEWCPAGQDTFVLRRDGVAAAMIWPDGDRWRAAATDDALPGDIHPTRDEATAAAVIIARNRVPVPPCGCKGGPGVPDTDGRCFTCSGTLDQLRDIIRRHRRARGDSPAAARCEAEDLAAKICAHHCPGYPDCDCCADCAHGAEIEVKA